MALNDTDPFAASGGGVKLANGAWVPKDHPLAQQQAASQPAGAPAGGYTPPPTGAAPPAGSITSQANNSQTFSQTPGAAPTQTTTNQGTQDVVRNSYLQQATQGTTIDPNDPNLKQQVDPYAAAQERGRRDYVSQAAERLSAQGLGNSGQMTQEARLAAENAANSTGAFQSQLVAKELQNRRDEVQNALTNLGGMISQDQARELQKQLADLDASIKQQGLASQESIAGMQNATQDKLGTGALNVDLLKALLQNQQFGQGQALGWSQFDWQTNPMNPANWQ